MAIKVEYLNDEINKLIKKCDHKTLVVWALDCTEHVYKYFDKIDVYEQRLHNAIGAARDWVKNRMLTWEVRDYALEIHEIVRKFKSNEVAYAVIRSAWQAAVTVHVTGHAIYAAAYAVKAVGYANHDVKKEREWQYNHLLKLYEKQIKNLKM